MCSFAFDTKMADENTKQDAYIRTVLIPRIFATKLQHQTLVSSTVVKDDQLEGFMSAIYNVELQCVDNEK